MIISSKSFDAYQKKQSEIRKKASDLMRQWIEKNGVEDVEALTEYAHWLQGRYGMSAMSYACQMYDEIASLEGVTVAPATPANTGTYRMTQANVQESLARSPTGQLVTGVVERLVKQAVEDTTLKNASRDKAYFAWIPHGDTCAFCIALASRGWVGTADATTATHIHAHCDCTFAVKHRFDTEYEGFNHKSYLERYNRALKASKGDKNASASQNAINAMRRQDYQANKDKINQQKREAYARRKDAEINKT